MRGLGSLIALSILLLSVLASTIPVTQATPEEKFWAVIVCGSGDIREETNLLYETLTTYYDFDDDNIYYLHVDTSVPGVDALATKQNVRWAFTNWLRSRSTSNDIVFIYMVSHGGGYNLAPFADEGLIPNTIVGGR